MPVPDPFACQFSAIGAIGADWDKQDFNVEANCQLSLEYGFP